MRLSIFNPGPGWNNPSFFWMNPVITEPQITRVFIIYCSADGRCGCQFNHCTQQSAHLIKISLFPRERSPRVWFFFYKCQQKQSVFHTAEVSVCFVDVLHCSMNFKDTSSLKDSKGYWGYGSEIYVWIHVMSQRSHWRQKMWKQLSVNLQLHLTDNIQLCVNPEKRQMKM